MRAQEQVEGGREAPGCKRRERVAMKSDESAAKGGGEKREISEGGREAKLCARRGGERSAKLCTEGEGEKRNCARRRGERSAKLCTAGNECLSSPQTRPPDVKIWIVLLIPSLFWEGVAFTLLLVFYVHKVASRAPTLACLRVFGIHSKS